MKFCLDLIDFLAVNLFSCSPRCLVVGRSSLIDRRRSDNFSPKVSCRTRSNSNDSRRSTNEIRARSSSNINKRFSSPSASG